MPRVGERGVALANPQHVAGRYLGGPEWIVAAAGTLELVADSPLLERSKADHAFSQLRSSQLAIVSKESGSAIGVSAYFEVRPEHRSLEIGNTWIARQFQRTKINPEAKFLMLTHAFEELGAIRVELKTDARNRQSRRGIEKLGAKREGILRSHMIMPDGHIRDTVVYSITAAEWPNVKESLIARLGYQPP